MDDLKKRIIEESCKAFLRYGIKAMTMNDISKQCGISKRTLYENFKDKDELLLHCVRAMNKQSDTDRNEGWAKHVGSIEQMMFSAKKIADDSRRINPTFFRELEKFYPKVEAVRMEHLNTVVFPDFVSLIDRGVEDGVFIKDVNTKLAARLFFGQVGLVLNTDIAEESGASMQEVLRMVIFGFIRGMATTKGMKVIEQYQNKNMAAI